MKEPVTFVVEHNLGCQEVAGVYFGKLPDRLTRKGSTLMVFAWRLDKLPNGAMLQQMPIADLYEQFVLMRAEGKLPPSNLADPPRKTDGGQKGSLRGEDSWWTPPPPPRGQDWTPDYQPPLIAQKVARHIPPPGPVHIPTIYARESSIVIGFEPEEPAVVLFPVAE